MLRTIVAGGFVVLYLVLVAPWFLLHAALTGRAELLYRVGMAGARAMMRLVGVRVRAEGLDNIPPGVCVFVANHASNADPPAVVCALPKRVALLAKKEVFRIPILSRALRLASFVSVDRADPESARESIEEALGQLRSGVSYLVFPEGTRSADGRLRPFKKGSFVMAIRAGVPVVPVSVVGAHRIMSKGSMVIRPGEIVVRFHRAVDAAAYTLEQRDELVARVYALVCSGLPEDQQPREDTR